MATCATHDSDKPTGRVAGKTRTFDCRVPWDLVPFVSALEACRKPVFAGRLASVIVGAGHAAADQNLPARGSVLWMHSSTGLCRVRRLLVATDAPDRTSGRTWRVVTTVFPLFYLRGVQQSDADRACLAGRPVNWVEDSGETTEFVKTFFR